jgi:hypothetical protein
MNWLYFVVVFANIYLLPSCNSFSLSWSKLSLRIDQSQALCTKSRSTIKCIESSEIEEPVEEFNYEVKLRNAAQNGDVTAVRNCLEDIVNPVNVDSSDSGGWTALHEVRQNLSVWLYM